MKSLAATVRKKLRKEWARIKRADQDIAAEMRYPRDHGEVREEYVTPPFEGVDEAGRQDAHEEEEFEPNGPAWGNRMGAWTLLCGPSPLFPHHHGKE